MRNFGVLKTDRDDNYKYEPNAGTCEECQWEGWLTDAETEYDWDEFKGNDIPYKVCPKCGGGIDNYYYADKPNDA